MVGVSPNSTHNLTIPLNHPYRLVNGRSFLFHCGPVQGRDGMIIWFDDRFFRELCGAMVAYMDGTFKVVPAMYTHRGSQFFSIHFFKEERLIPAIYVLLPGKSAPIYEDLFQIIIDHANSINIIIRWRTVMTDFESGLCQAIRNKFIHLDRLEGCFFHFCKAVYAHINENHDLRYLYNLEGTNVANLKQ